MTASLTADDLAMQPPVVTLGDAPDWLEPRLFQGIPGIEVTANGRLWATWYGGGNNENVHNYIMLATSDDAGRTWTQPWLWVAFQGNVRLFDPALWLDPLGRLWLFWAQTASNITEDGKRTNYDGRGGVWAIRCDQPTTQPQTWTAPRRFCDGVMLNRPVTLRSGEWLLPVSLWGLGGDRPDVTEPRTPSALITEDAGETFRWISGPPSFARFDEHHIIEMPNGDWHLYMRARPTAMRSISTDRGKTWSTPESSCVPCPDTRFFIGRLASSHLLMVTHVADPADKERRWAGRKDLTAWISRDDGQTWHGGLLLDERYPTSYPDAVQDAAGIIHVIYDFSRHDERDILMARFTEDDVLRGDADSPTVQRKMVVNTARHVTAP